MTVNKKIEMPIPNIEFRKTNEDTYKKALLSGIPAFYAKIIANRNIPSFITPKDIFNPSLKGLDVYKLKDIKKAADRIADAVINKEKIGLLCDFDVDGISSGAVLYSSFINYFNCEPENIIPYISNRMKAGYGFSSYVLNSIISSEPIPTLLITADQGSKDEERIAEYYAFIEKNSIKGADVIVTDHHHVKGKGPESAFATVNPQREDCEFIDKTICGCTVALLVMVAVRDSLIEKKYLSEDSKKLTELLTFSTAATIADCVSMASPLNRAIVIRGLKDMNAGTKAPWRVMKSLFSDENKILRTDSIGFGLGPRINACSRTGGDGLVALKFYLSDTDFEANRYLSMLDFQNEDRKNIEQRLLKEALLSASEYYSKGANSFVVFLEDGHHGVHGIVASRLCERYGRPTICLSPKEYDVEVEEIKEVNSKGISRVKTIEKKKIYTVTGSARSIPIIDIHLCMERVAEKYPDMFLGFGGHSMAAGMSLKVENIDLLRNAIDFEVTKMLNGVVPHPVVLVDGEFDSDFIIDLNFFDKLLELEPYGNGFEYPIFKIKAKIESFEIKGSKKDTGIFQIVFGKYLYEAIWFKFDQSPMFKLIKSGDFCEMAISIREQTFRGKRKLNLHIVHAKKID